MAETKEEVFRFRVCDIAQFWDNDAKKMWSQMQCGSPTYDYQESNDPLYELSRCKVTVTPKTVTIENHKGKVIAKLSSCFNLFNALPPVLRMASMSGLCYENTPEGIAAFESGQ